MKHVAVAGRAATNQSASRCPIGLDSLSRQLSDVAAALAGMRDGIVPECFVGPAGTNECRDGAHQR